MKGAKKTKGAFIPGKGMRQYETFDELVAVSNPALQVRFWTGTWFGILVDIGFS